MDYNHYNNSEQNQPDSNYHPQLTPSPKSNNFAIASMVCGIVSIVLCCIGLSLPISALGILFAVLTYRKGQMLDSMSITGSITSSIGLFLSIFMIVGTLIQLPAMMKDPVFREELDTVYEQLYGEDFADFWENYGIEME